MLRDEGAVALEIEVLPRSRRELVGKVFFAHYEPRLRDNERRVAVGDPVRGGPFRGDADAC